MSLEILRTIGCYAWATALAPIAWLRRCPQCFQRQITTEVAPHRDGSCGVFWRCHMCSAMVQIV